MGKKQAVPALHGRGQAPDYVRQSCHSVYGFAAIAVPVAAIRRKVLDRMIPGRDAEKFQYFVLVQVEAWRGQDFTQFLTAWPVPLRFGGVDYFKRTYLSVPGHQVGHQCMACLPAVSQRHN